MKWHEQRIALRQANGYETSVRLGAPLGQGGMGTVYRVRGDANTVVKLFGGASGFADDERERLACKLAAMLASPPDLPTLEHTIKGRWPRRGGLRYVQIAWPTALALESSGRIAGFAMPAVATANTASLESLMDARDALDLGLPTTLGKKVTLGYQLASVITTLHRTRHYVVDLKPINLNFYTDTLYMAILDCDGFSVCAPHNRFEARQYTEDYLAPEFQDSLDPDSDPEAQDRFGLAVILFRLLNHGIHPYAGVPTNPAVPNELRTKIKQNLYAYARIPHPHHAPLPQSTHGGLPDDLRDYFERAFGPDPRQRPSASSWQTILEDYARPSAGKIVPCKANTMHWHFAALPCAECRLIARRAVAHTQATQIMSQLSSVSHSKTRTRVRRTPSRLIQVFWSMVGAGLFIHGGQSVWQNVFAATPYLDLFAGIVPLVLGLLVWLALIDRDVLSADGLIGGTLLLLALSVLLWCGTAAFKLIYAW